MKKTLIFTLFLFLLSSLNAFSEEVRNPAVAGAFYPSDKSQLRELIDSFLANAGKADIKGRIFAIIAPHAGYVYSGQVAAHGYKQLEGRRINRVVIVSNSHKAMFSGIAIDASKSWQTPLGLISTDKELSDSLVNGSASIFYDKDIHKYDHTIEVQLPFLQTVIEGDFNIVPVLFGNSRDENYKILARLLAANLTKDDILIVSTDMSHYPSHKDATSIDLKTAELIKSGDIKKLDAHIDEIRRKRIAGEETLCCGIDGVKTAMELQGILGKGSVEILNYANSGDSPIGDKSRVVGYLSIIMSVPEETEKKGAVIMKDEYLNKKERQELITIARNSIIEAVTGKGQAGVEVTEGRLKEKSGAFVTIKKHGQLRGCIGYIIGVKPLYETVKDVAASAAINDPRFRPVSESELDELELEISALTPLSRIDNIDEIEVGKHGLYMKRGFYSGLLLPQVATEYGWDRETFLEQTCRKAGLSKDAWKDDSTEIYIFSAEVFDENNVK